MDDARKLLDSLMGNHRNIDISEAKKKKGQNFKERDVCKHFLVGFCPQNEHLFHNTKRDLGTCHKVHSDALREEFEASPDYEKYRSEYEQKLIQYLTDLTRIADEWVARERSNLKDFNEAVGEKGPGETAKLEIKKLQDSAQMLLEEAEASAEMGDIESSKGKLEQAEELKAKASWWETKARSERKDDICLVCGSRMETTADPETARERHLESKIHLGYDKIRTFLAKLRERERGNGDRETKRDGSNEAKEDKNGDKKEDKPDEKKARDEKKDKDRRDRRDDDRDRRGGQDRKERSRSRKRSRSRRRSRSRDRRDRRDDRGRDRSRDRDRRDRRDRR